MTSGDAAPPSKAGRLSIRRCAFTGAVMAMWGTGAGALTKFGGFAWPSLSVADSANVIRHLGAVLGCGAFIGFLAGALLALVYNAFEVVER